MHLKRRIIYLTHNYYYSDKPIRIKKYFIYIIILYNIHKNTKRYYAVLAVVKVDIIILKIN